MDLDLLKSFIAVAEARSFSGAARALHSTQPTVSRQIARLEDQLGAPLFERFGRNVECTPVGQMLLPLARAITTRVDDAVSIVREHVGAGKRTLHFGAPQRVFACLLAPMLVSFARAYPHVKIDLKEGDDSDLEGAVAQGELDCAVITPWKSTRTAAQLLLTDEIVILVPVGHKLATQGEIELRMLARESMLLPRSTMNVANIIADAFAQEGLQLKYACRVECTELVAELVKGGMGIAAMPTMLIPEQRNGLVALRLKKPLARHLALIYPRDRALSPAARALMAHIRAGVRGHRPGLRPG